MDCSIIICTRNRAESLRSTLESIGRVTVPAGWRVELLVVDNGSTDHTRAVVNEARMDHIRLRRLSESRSGQCHARNSGLVAAGGEVILFTDDDVRVPPNWIVAMAGPIRAGTADAVAGGVGLPRELDEAAARLDLSTGRSWFASTEDLDRDWPARMVGANMAFHRRVLDQVPGFEVELGPGALGFHDETLFSFQLLAAGCKLIGMFDAPVEHQFDLARLTRESLMDTARKMGRSRAFIFHHWEHQKSRLVIPRLILCHLRRLGMRLLDRGKGARDNRRFNRVLNLEQELAFYREYVVQRRRPFKYALRGLVPQAAAVKVEDFALNPQQHRKPCPVAKDEFV